MATKKTARTAAAEPAPQPTAGPNPPASAFVTLWVFTQALAEQLGQPMGFVQVLRADAPDLIATGGAVDPATTTEPLPYVEGDAPLGWPRPAPAPPAPAPSPPAPAPEPEGDPEQGETQQQNPDEEA